MHVRALDCVSSTTQSYCTCRGVSLEPTVDAASARQLFFSVPQPDDSGADTLDRYDWQATMAAADGLRIYLDSLDESGNLSNPSDSRVVCEYHEDWAVISDGAIELVSAKHRDTAKGAYTTINELASTGGVAHLFDRWHALSESPTCRVVTTAGLAPEVQKLEKAWESLRYLRQGGEPLTVAEEHAQPVSSLCQSLRKYCKKLPDWWASHDKSPSKPTDREIAQVTRFLSLLNVECSKPLREYIAFAAPNMYAKPVCDRLQLSVDPESVWSAVQRLFYARMHKAGPLPTGKLPAVLAYKVGSTLPDVDDQERTHVNRIVTTADINVAIKTAISQPSGYRPMPRLLRTTRLAVKMAEGQCSDNSVERAEHLMHEFREFWREARSGDPTARASQALLSRHLLRMSDEATESTRDVVPRGPAFWQELQRRIDSMPPEQIPVGMDGSMILGGISDLTSQCKVWFSDRFDVDAVIDRLRREQGQTS